MVRASGAVQASRDSRNHPDRAARHGQPTPGRAVDRRAGKQRIYRVDPDGLGVLRAEIDRFWSKTLVAYKAVVEQRTKEE